MRKKILQKAIVSCLIIILSISVLPVIEADNEQYFTGQDCECPDLGMELITITYQWNQMFKARFEKNSSFPTSTSSTYNTFITHETWNYHLDSDKAISYFWRDVDRSQHPSWEDDGRNGYKNWYNKLLEDPNFEENYDIVEASFELPEGALIYGDFRSYNSGYYTSPLYKGWKKIVYKDIFFISISGDYFESKNAIVTAFDTLESCIKDVLDARGGDQDVAKVLKGRITTSDVPRLRNLRELTSVETFDELKEKYVELSTIVIVPLKHMKIVLREGDSKTETTTDSDGNYEITINNFQENKEYELVIHFEYIIDNTTYFSIYFQNVPVPVSNLVFHTIKFKIKSDSDLTQDIKLDNIFTIENEGFSFIALYLHTAEAFEFYKDILAVDLDFQLPVNIYTYLTDAKGIKYRWENGRSFIDIDFKNTSWQNPNRPIREFHEVSHYAMHCLYKKMPEGRDTPIKMVNHDGYVNPSTADSFSEAFAIFMSMVIAEHYNLLLYPDHYITYGSLEDEYEPWRYKGKMEEGALAGILWDLYDGPEEYEFRRSFDLEYELERFEIDPGQDETRESIIQDNKDKVYDDDEVDLTLEQIWGILKVYHPDFYSVYNAFITNFTDQKAEIDEIFECHGCFADTREGNGIFDSYEPSRGEYFVDLPEDNIIYDEDEIMGKATNYERPWRSGMALLPGHFIKVDNSVPNYWLSYHYADKPYMTYYIQTQNINGKVYVFVPPEPYEVDITIEAAGVETTNPLTISSSDFQDEYANSVDQGYYMEHTFEFVGDVPSEPKIPEMLFGTDTNGNNGSPGLEFNLIIICMISILFWMKKRRK